MLKEKLKQRVEGALIDAKIGNTPLNKVVEQLNCDAYLFGGFLRDLMLCKTVRPRDIDIVVALESVEPLLKIFEGYQIRRTRFGGIHFEVKGVPFDIWPLKETWAFREGHCSPRVEDLPKTTFLNIEAVACKIGIPTEIYEHGFFDAIQRKVLEINLEINPYPALQLLRAFVISTRFGFTLGPKLSEYVHTRYHKLSKEELLAAMASHYGTTVDNAFLKELDTWVALQEY